MSAEIDPKLLNKLSLMLYPENLEQMNKLFQSLMKISHLKEKIYFH